MNATNHPENRLFTWGMLAALLVAYALPWLANPAAGLTLGAYDLAEWVSLHAGARAASPPLLPVLLLRLPLVLLTFMVAISPALNLWLRLLFVLLASAALLPPLEFFASDLADPNYRQQVMLAAATLLVGLAALNRAFKRYATPILAALMIAGVVVVIWGNLWGLALMQAFQLPTRLGVGGVLYTALLLIYGAVVIYPVIRRAG